MLIVCEAVLHPPPHTPNVKVQDYNGVQLKGNVQFLPRKQHYLHFEQKKIESSFFSSPKRIIALYLKAELLRRRKRRGIVKGGTNLFCKELLEKNTSSLGLLWFLRHL